MKIIEQKDIKTTNWSGGTTSELFIYPRESQYKNLDFKFRLSRATIEVKTSDFTPLPNVKRILMLLDGELELIHKNHHSKHLKPYQFDTFMGNWQTKCIIKSDPPQATDFNLMMLDYTQGTLSVIKTKKNQFHKYKINNDFTVFYVAEGKMKHNHKTLTKGELLIIDYPQPNKFEFKVTANSNIIVARIDV